MYSKRIKIFIIFSSALLLVCILRLGQMQLVDDSSYREKITELKRRRGHSQRLKTIRGKILDRNGKVLAVDEPQFYLQMDYRLSCFMDNRVRRAKILRAAAGRDAERAVDKVQKELETKAEILQQIIEKCTHFGFEYSEIEGKIKKKNDKIWALRTYLAWKRNYPNKDFEQAFRNANEKLLLAAKVDIAEMYQSWSLLELETDNDIFTAQLEFMDTNGVSILPKPKRVYPFDSVAAQTIGWVGPATQQEDIKLFEGDELARYLEDEVCGREDGVEYVCEAILRGKRGKVFYDIDRKPTDRTETQFGKDVSITLDIELQQRIENYLVDPRLNPEKWDVPMGAVVIDVATGDILAMASVPVYNLNEIRSSYGKIEADPNEPLRNRVINELYPPGSIIKPIILIAGLQEGKVRPDEIISCPAQRAPRGWPNCWYHRKYSWLSHDIQWQEQGGNIARNAIKGSCNIFFTRLADMLAPDVLQQWLLDFGYGREMLLPPAAIMQNKYERNLRQVNGQITSGKNTSTITLGDRRYFGMGQGNLRVSVLQVANSMAVLARNGRYKNPRLFIDEAEDNRFDSTILDVSSETLDVVLDGMNAVVNEPGGTANSVFAPAGFEEQGVNVYGKTGSTEGSKHAWFAGFAKDNEDRSIAIAVLVEGGEHGSSDAGPLARDIIQFCIEAGYIGKSQAMTE